MPRVLKTAIVAIALLSLVPNSFAADQKVSINGTLKVAKVKGKKKTGNQFILVDSAGKKTLLYFRLKDKTNAPEVKPFLNKKVVISGMGSTRIVRDVTQITFSEVRFKLADEGVKKDDGDKEDDAPAPDEEM